MTVFKCGKCQKAIRIPEKYVKKLNLRGDMYRSRESGPDYEPRLLRDYLGPLGWKVEEYSRGCNEAEGEHGCPSDWTFHEISIRCPDCPGRREEIVARRERERQAEEEIQRQRQLEEERLEKERADKAKELASRAEPIIPSMLKLLEEYKPDAIRAALKEAELKRKS